MSVFLLNRELVFPNPEFAEPDGLLAIGGDLSPERIILAYKEGIFPWYNYEPILWWSPPLRPVIFPHLFHMSRSLYQTLKREIYRVTFDRDFYSVIYSCATTPRKNSSATWITLDMFNAYCNLYEYGYAHSVEVWYEDELVGGLYGVAIGRFFSGESMFTKMKDASKVALACLVEHLIENNFYFIDCQVTNPHLLSLGAIEIPRAVYINLVKEAIKFEHNKGSWNKEIFSTANTAKFLRENLIRRKK
ncbi:MAG: leucyl/phenylalanyl-tRNA--protein transferase [Thermodesulfovibrionaceae bacterium]